MATFTPAYRLAIYAPRSVDPLEATVLTPAAGAPHAEAFRVATIAGLVGWAPYLEVPTGRRGRFDPLTKRTDAGELTFRLLDARTGAGDNARRWATAFAGDATGAPIVPGCRAAVEESLDGGATWSAFFAGRVVAFTWDGPLFAMLTVREEVDRLRELCFVQPPLASVTYARAQAVLPVQGPPNAGIPYVQLAGTVTREPSIPNGFRIRVADYDARKLDGNVASAGLAALALAEFTFGQTSADPATGVMYECLRHLGYDGSGNRLHGAARARLVVTWSGGTGEYAVYRVACRRTEVTSYYAPFEIEAVEYVAGTLGATTRPPDGAACTFAIVADVAASEATPVVITNAAPLTLWRDILDGKFSRLTAAGAVRRTIAYDAAAFAALAAAEHDYIPVDAVITKPMEMGEFVERYILRPYHLGFRMDGAGRVVPFDCRRRNGLTAALALGDADLADVTRGFAWEQSAAGAITTASVETYRDTVEPVRDLIAKGSRPVLGQPAGVVSSSERRIVVADFSPRALDVTAEEYALEAPGWRVRSAHPTDPVTVAREGAIEAAAVALVAQLRALYGAGATDMVRAFRRSSVAAVLPGDWCRLTVREAPNAATLERGGERVALVVDRVEDREMVVLSFVDGGVATAAAVPTLAGLALDADGIVQVTITRNAAGDPVALEYVLSASVLGAPPTTGWRDGGLAVADGVVALPRVPAGHYLYVRGRSMPVATSADFFLPSAYAAPAPAYVATGTITAPSGVAVGALGRSVGTVTWTNGDASLPVEVLVSTGSYAAGLFDDAGLVVATLPPGTTSYLLRGLDGPSVAHVVAVRHRDPVGRGLSAIAYANFTTGTTNPTAPRPAGLALIAPLG